jgi:hypothetical protein
MRSCQRIVACPAQSAIARTRYFGVRRGGGDAVMSQIVHLARRKVQEQT